MATPDVPAAEAPAFKAILVPTDFSASAEAAWALARRLARAVGARLLLVHVLVEPPLYREGPFTADHVRDVYAAARSWTSDRLAEWAEAARADGLTVRVELREGVPHEQIAALARDARADLIVMGTQGRSMLGSALLGGVADRVIRTAPCPVLTVRE